MLASQKDVKPLRENKNFYNTSSFCIGIHVVFSNAHIFICAMLLFVMAALGYLR